MEISATHYFSNLFMMENQHFRHTKNIHW